MLKIFNTGLFTRGSSKIQLSNGAAVAHMPPVHLWGVATIDYEHRGKLIILHGSDLLLPALQTEIADMICTIKNSYTDHAIITPSSFDTIEGGRSYPLRIGEWCHLIADVQTSNWIVLL